jgi:hypothetical protein
LVSGAQMGKWFKTMTNYKMSDAHLQGMNALTSIFNGLNSKSDKGVALGVFNLVSSGIKLIETKDTQYKLDDDIDRALGIYGYTQTAAGLHDAFAKGESKAIVLAVAGAAQASLQLMLPGVGTAKNVTHINPQKVVTFGSDFAQD